MAKIDLSIIIINYNTAKLLTESLKSVLKYLGDVNFEVIIVDNGSSENDVEKLNKIIQDHKNVPASRSCHPELDSGSRSYINGFRIPTSLKLRGAGKSGMTHKEKSGNTDINITLLKSPKNRGFGAGNNQAAKEASGDYLLFLNSDTLVVDDSVNKMLAFLKNHSEIGALTPLLLMKNGETLQRHFYGRFQNLLGLTFRQWQGRKIDRRMPFVYTQMVSGAAMMIRTDLFRKIGGFDENFFMYLEDDDLCRRLTRIGYKNAVLTTAKIIHLEGQSTGGDEKKRFYYQSQNYYWRKHNGFVAMWLMRLIRVPYLLVKKFQNSKP